MTLSDEFGDSGFSVLEQSILELERLTAIRAAEHSRGKPNSDFEDLKQEGRIAVWEAATKRPDAPREYLSAANSMRMMEAATRGKWTGMPSQQGKPSVDPLRRWDRDSLDDPDVAVFATAPEVIDEVSLAYHAGELAAALEALPEQHRRYVVLRFWYGMGPTEIAEYVDVRPKNMARMWAQAIRPVLAEHLKHLENA